jgi:hypothetical protein
MDKSGKIPDAAHHSREKNSGRFLITGARGVQAAAN